MELNSRVITRYGEGIIAFMGETQFSTGTWLGIKLDAPNGKNSGSVQGVSYFTCEDKHGLFVRPEQVQLKSPTALQPKMSRRSTNVGIKAPTATRANTRSSMATSQPGPGLQRDRSRLSRLSTASAASNRSSKTPKSPVTTPKDESPAPVKPSTPPPNVGTSTPKNQQTQPPSPEKTSINREISSVRPVESGVSMAEINSLKAQVKDWKSRCDLLQTKRREDAPKLREAERLRMQLQGIEATNKRLAENLKSMSAKYEEKSKLYEEKIEETTDVQEQIENAILEKEMAETKMEEIEEEMENLKEKLEEVETDYELLKAEVDEHGMEGASETFQNKALEEEKNKLQQAVIQLKQLFNNEKLEASRLKTEFEDLKKAHEKTSQKYRQVCEQLDQKKIEVAELMEQVEASADVQELVEKLTDQLFDKDQLVTELIEKCDDLERMNEMNDELLEEAKNQELLLREDIDLGMAVKADLEAENEALKVEKIDYLWGFLF